LIGDLVDQQMPTLRKLQNEVSSIRPLVNRMQTMKHPHEIYISVQHFESGNQISSRNVFVAGISLLMHTGYDFTRQPEKFDIPLVALFELWLIFRNTADNLDTGSPCVLNCSSSSNPL
jgi:hypothetical protein